MKAPNKNLPSLTKGPERDIPTRPKTFRQEPSQPNKWPYPQLCQQRPHEQPQWPLSKVCNEMLQPAFLPPGAVTLQLLQQKNVRTAYGQWQKILH